VITSAANGAAIVAVWLNLIPVMMLTVTVARCLTDLGSSYAHNPNGVKGGIINYEKAKIYY
jgi:hypothetical protein